MHLDCLEEQTSNVNTHIRISPRVQRTQQLHACYFNMYSTFSAATANRYNSACNPLLLGGQRQHKMRSFPDTSTHDQQRESNPRPLDLQSNTIFLATSSHVSGWSTAQKCVLWYCSSLLVEAIWENTVEPFGSVRATSERKLTSWANVVIFIRLKISSLRNL